MKAPSTKRLPEDENPFLLRKFAIIFIFNALEKMYSKRIRILVLHKHNTVEIETHIQQTLVSINHNFKLSMHLLLIGIWFGSASIYVVVDFLI